MARAKRQNKDGRRGPDPRRSFKDPAAAVVWAAISVLPEGAQHQLAEELLEHLAIAELRQTGQEIRVARAVGALREVAKNLGGASPTVSQYREQQAKHPECRWPSDRSIRNWLSDSGSWDEALKAARLDSLPDPVPDHPGQGPNMTDTEILAALKECAKDRGISVAEISWAEYLRWARSADVLRRLGRRPRSQTPFDRLGGFRTAKRLAMGGSPEQAEAAIVAAGADGHGYRYTERELYGAADEILQRLGPEAVWPSTTEWPRERSAILAEEAAAGKPPRAIPGAGIVWNRFRSWPAARYAYEQARGKQ